ncbi:restriction endonuclease subunit S [Pseudoalteromonas sp. SR43-3]|uniref:restriction endonuclease subunit S n=1 Tax=Pseudoalteromonas sp. SR43-3 TaxID=2760943 RepID=UPI00160247E0|nr:restriction endonuclease subunit S [Pseudoalteromonas sp. SR43-3]MBB1275887.1 restriction endonuclease subunit S [Pseudoalteromonas sp. SR43-3]
MGSDWPFVSIEDIAEVKSGKRLPKGNELVEHRTEFPYIRLVDVSNGRVDSENLKFLLPKTQEKISRYIVDTDDICLAIVGHTIGMVFYIDSKWSGVNLTENAARITNVSSDFNPRYIYYYLNSSIGQNEIISRKVGSAQGKLPLYNIKSLEIPKVPRAYQDNVVQILDKIDSKIELNKKTNNTLEQMAQALFKSWFVDFDPVFDNLLASVDFKLESLENRLPDNLKLKAQRRLAVLNSLENAAECKASLIALAHELQAQLPTKEATQAAVQVSEKAAETSVKANLNANPNILAQHANTHAHFPCEFEHNEQLGWIPKCWEKGTFKDIADGLSGYAFKGKDFSETGFAVLKIKNITTVRSVVINDVNRVSPEVIDKLQRFLLNDGDIIMAMTGATVGKFGVLVSEDNEAYYLNQRVCKLTPKMEKGNPFLFSALNQPGVEEGILSAAQGSAQPNISANGILATKLLVPSKKTIEIFNRLLEDVYERKITLRKECYKLTKLRDTLLPKLISGELQIPDVAIDEEVVD